MEIIFNKNMCESVTGRINRRVPWYIRERKGHFYAAYTGDKNADLKKAWFRVFVRDLLKLQDAKYISELVFTEEERRWVEQ